MYEGLPFYDQYPKRLRTIGFPTSETVAANAVAAESNTVLRIEAFLGTNATALNYTAMWDQTKPDSNLLPLSILLNRTYPTLISKEQTKNVRNPFYADYAAVHDGRLPFVDPVPLVSRHCILYTKDVPFEHDSIADMCCTMKARWKFGDSLPASELDVAVKNKTLFKNWWETHVLPPAVNDSATCSESLILYTSGVKIVYRNTYLRHVVLLLSTEEGDLVSDESGLLILNALGSPPIPPFGYDDSQISLFAEVPDFVVPRMLRPLCPLITIWGKKLMQSCVSIIVGAAAYDSTVTNHTEVLPVSVDIIGTYNPQILFTLVLIYQLRLKPVI
jgi:hypothetical protein